MNIRVDMNNMLHDAIGVVVNEFDDSNLLSFSLKIYMGSSFIRLDLSIREARDLADTLNRNLAEADQVIADKVQKTVKAKNPALKFNKLDKKKIEKVREVRMVVYP